VTGTTRRKPYTLLKMFLGFVLRLFVIINNDEHSVVDVFGLVGELCPDPGFHGGGRLFILQSWLLADEGVLRLPGGRTDGPTGIPNTCPATASAS
jgi:hypothetical protein